MRNLILRQRGLLSGRQRDEEMIVVRKDADGDVAMRGVRGVDESRQILWQHLEVFAALQYENRAGYVPNYLRRIDPKRAAQPHSARHVCHSRTNRDVCPRLRLAGFS